jgi:hypothetical protein
LGRLALKNKNTVDLEFFSGSCHHESTPDNHVHRFMLHAQLKTARDIAHAQVVTVEDDGQGFNLKAPLADGNGHFGLNIMRAGPRLGGD